jgi:fatty acid desaturase
MMTRTKLWPWFWRVAFDWSIIAACFCAAYWVPHPAIWLACVVIIGARQHALAILGHDGAHRMACRNRFLNDTLTGLLCFWPLGFAINGYRRFHFKHHRTVGTDEDPELIHKNHKWLGQWQTPMKLLLHVTMDCLGGSLPHLGMAAYLTRPTSLLDQLGPALTISGLVALTWWIGCLWIPLLWFGSLWTSFFVVFRFRLWTEHVGTTGTHRISATWWQRFLFLPHNTWCHWEHHECSSIPCWALPDARDRSASILTVGELFRQLSREQVSRSRPPAQVNNSEHVAAL